MEENKFIAFFKKIPAFLGKLVPRKFPPIGWIAYFVVLIGLAVGAFIFTRNFVKTQQIFRLPGVAIAESTAAPADNGEAALPAPTLDAPDTQLPVPWDGGSRVTVLVLGLDERDWEVGEGAPRSDTMMLLTIDPVSKTAGMMSVPRDMWVNIPGSGYGKINTAYSIGEGAKLPGGGPGLAMKTVEEFIGIPIQYYVQVDFAAFEEAIDAMGGLELDIPAKIRLDPIGKKKPENIKPGKQVLPGYLVLAYARNRYTQDGDVDRARRQQQVIMALRDKVLAPENFPEMVKLAPKVYNEVAPLIRTNMSFDDALRLASLASQVPRENYKQGIIDYTMMTLGTSPDGLSIVKPMPDKIRVLRDDVFMTGGALSPIAQGTPTQLMQADAARVRVSNGSYTQGLAESTAQYLQSQGMGITELGNANATDATVITLYSDKLYTTRYLLTMFANTGVQLVVQPDPASTVDIDIALGNAWASNPNPPAQQ
jgi:LCP family protein required for cell wall assembly